MSASRSAWLLALLLAVPALAAGAPEAPAKDEAVKTEPVIEVTASPIIDGNKSDHLGSFRTTVSARQIESLNAVDVAAALRRTPGVTISRFNPVGSFGGEEGGAVYIRGMGTSRPGSEIKTYVDGVPFYMAVWNHPLLDLLPINGMGRIDVYKGPQPQAFGNTFGAVDLLPKRAGDADGVISSISGRAGSFSSIIEQADVVGRQGAVDYAFAQGYARSDGHRDQAEGELLNVMGQVGYRFSPAWSARFTVLHADNTARDPGHNVTLVGKGDRYDTEGQLGSLAIRHQTARFDHELKLYYDRGKSVQDPGLTSEFTMLGLRYREDARPWKGGRLTGGLDLDQLSGTVDPVGFESPDLQITSPSAALAQTIELSQGWTLTPSVGARFYQHSELGSETAPHAGLVLEQGDRFSLRTNFALGVDYPGIDAAVLSHLIPPLGITWKSLKAERMDHVEAGFAWKLAGTTTLDAAVFQDQLKDRYVFAFPPAVPSPSFVNLGDYDVSGTEFSRQHRIGSAWSLFAGVTTLDPTKDDLPYAPKTSFTAGVNFTQGGWSASLDAQNQSEMTVLGQARADGSANTVKVDAFTVASARVAYLWKVAGRSAELSAGCENLLDEAYEFRAGYPMPGRSFQFGLKAGF